MNTLLATQYCKQYTMESLKRGRFRYGLTLVQSLMFHLGSHQSSIVCRLHYTPRNEDGFLSADDIKSQDVIPLLLQYFPPTNIKYSQESSFLSLFIHYTVLIVIRAISDDDDDNVLRSQ